MKKYEELKKRQHFDNTEVNHRKPIENFIDNQSMEVK